jgi:hypothetical protein
MTVKTTLLCALLTLSSLSSGCLLPEEREEGAGFRHVVKRQSNGTPVGTGDRFSGGSVVPRGLGSQTASFTTLLNPNEVKSGLQGLVSAYGIQTFETPYKTFEGRTIQGAKVGGTGTCNNAYKVYINGNIHARERGSMDNVLYFISDLLYANKNNVGLKYGSKTYTAAQVKTALSAGIVFIPNSNPDGVAYDQSSNSCWRKNRNTASGTGRSAGVDLNRNFDFLWDFTRQFSSSVQGSVASTSPSSETYHGTSAFSEPETKSIKWVFDTYPRVRWFVDLHSYAGDVLYSWGSDDNQSTSPYQNFRNNTYNGVRGVLGSSSNGNAYREYTPQAENNDNIAAAKRIAAGLTAGGGSTYGAIQASDLYPTSGASDDYAYSRHFADTSKNLVHSYTIEFGFGNNAASCPFYPTAAQYNTNIKATGAGFMEFLLAAVEIGLGDGGC